MSETTQETQVMEKGPKRFLRSRDDKVAGGVAGGLGRYFGIDPVLFRVGAVASVFVGGIGLFIYLVLWIGVPADDGTGKPAGPAPYRRWFGGADGRIKVGRALAIVAAVIGAMIAMTALTAGAIYATGSGQGTWVAVALIVIGIGAVVGALAGRRKSAWLLVPAAVIAIPTGLVAAADVKFEGGVGEKHYKPTTLSAVPAHGYKLAAGHMRLDLRDMQMKPGSNTNIPVQIGMGAGTIIVPPSVCVQNDSRIGAGYIDVLGYDEGGFDVRRRPGAARSKAPRVTLHADVGMGALEIITKPQDSQFEDRGPRRSETHQARGNAACRAVTG
jgi:phage shock protein PspC (stress-responsive transcriptional regulator)